MTMISKFRTFLCQGKASTEIFIFCRIQYWFFIDWFLVKGVKLVIFTEAHAEALL